MKTKKRTYTKWSIEQKKKIVAQYEQGGEAIVDVCTQHGIYTAQFYMWSKQIRDKTMTYKTGTKVKRKMQPKFKNMKEINSLITKLRKLVNTYHRTQKGKK